MTTLPDTHTSARGFLDLPSRDLRKYSLLTAIRAKCDAIMLGRARFDGLEAECDRTLAKTLGEHTSVGAFYIPWDIASMKRDLTVGVTTAGGFLVETVNASFFELLRARTLTMRLGAQELLGQIGSVTVPALTGGASYSWLASEATQAGESTHAFLQFPLTPKTVAAYSELSRQLLLQSNPSAEAIVMGDLAATLGVARDRAALQGATPNSEPTGLIYRGIGTVAGASPCSYDALLEFQSDVLSANALANPATCGYLAWTASAKSLANRQRFAGTTDVLWEGNLANGILAGFPAYSTQQMPMNGLIFGDWSQLIYVTWGTLAVEVNPFANFPAGIVGIRAMLSTDLCARHPLSFSFAASAS